MLAKPLRVLIIYPPFGLIESPSLGVGVVKAATVEAGFPCDVLYASVEFADLIGFQDYLLIAHSDSQILLPERLFAAALSSNIPTLEQYYERLVLPFNQAFSGFIAPRGSVAQQVERYKGLEKRAIRLLRRAGAAARARAVRRLRPLQQHRAKPRVAGDRQAPEGTLP